MKDSFIKVKTYSHTEQILLKIRFEQVQSDYIFAEKVPKISKQNDR